MTTERLTPGLTPLLAILLGFAVVRVPSLPFVLCVLIVAGLVVVASTRARSAMTVDAMPVAASPAMRASMGALVLALAAYQLLFNFVGGGARLAGAGALGGAFVLLAVLAAPRAGRHGGALLLLASAPFAASILGALLGHYRIGSGATFRELFPYVVAAALVLQPDLVPPRAAKFAGGGMIVIGLLISFAHGRRVVSDVSRLTPFTGGLDVGAHSSAYVLAVSIILLNEVYRRGEIRRWLVYGLMGVGAVGLLEFKVATAIVMTAVYFVVRHAEDAPGLGRKVTLAVIVGILAVGGYQLRVSEKMSQQYGNHATSTNSLSSGRLSAWTQRLGIIDGRSGLALALGTGTGSDLIATTAWSGDTKNSHNDFLMDAIEHGLLGLGVLATLLLALTRRAGRSGRAVVLAFLTSAILSNGLLLSRPMIMPFIWVAVALAMQTAASVETEAAIETAAETARFRPRPVRRVALAPAPIGAAPLLRPPSRSRIRAHGMRVRTSLGFADQGVSSFTNFAGTAIAARVLRASELGHFAVVGAIFVLVTVVVRGAVSERIVLTLSARSRAISDEMHFAAGVTLLTGALAAGCLAAGAEASYGGMRLSLVVCGGLLPGLLLQDYLRFVALTIRQPARALVLDSVWLLLEIPAFGLLLHSHNHAAWAALLAWLLPGALAAPLGFWLIPVRPRLRGSVAWLRANLAISVRFAIDNVIAQNTGLLLILVLAVVSSSAQVGYFRVAQAALLPPAVLAAGVRLAMVPELVRLREANPSGFRRLVRLSALGLVVVVVVWGLVLDLAPQWVGRALFGHTWPHVQDLVLLTTVATAAGGVCMAAFSGIRACGDASGSLRTRIRVAVVNMAAGTIGGMFFGAMGATIGLAVTVPLAAAMWWVQLGRSQRRVFDSSIEAAAPPHDVALLESAV